MRLLCRLLDHVKVIAVLRSLKINDWNRKQTYLVHYLISISNGMVKVIHDLLIETHMVVNLIDNVILVVFQWCDCSIIFLCFFMVKISWYGLCNASQSIKDSSSFPILLEISFEVFYALFLGGEIANFDQNTRSWWSKGDSIHSWLLY